LRRAARAAAILAATFLSIRAARSAEETGPAAAERKYRVAQRLGADGSAEAPAAFEKVVALAPRGPLADDALVDLARLRGAPDWPEELGALDAERAGQARRSLETVVNDYADGDRVVEARYRLALVGLAPIPGRDAGRARQDLIALASDPSGTRWVVAARYALGVLDEQAGDQARAAGAYARILIERPDGEVAARARAGFGRTLLGDERFGLAAGWFQEAIEDGVPPVLRAVEQRELALREVVRERVPARRWGALTTKLGGVPTARGASLLAAAPDGRLVVYDRKTEALQMFDAQGTGAAPLPMQDVTAVATDAYGRVFAAAKDKLLRWDASGPTVLSSLAAFESPAAIAVSASGSIWIADRKGDRIGKWTPGMAAPVLVVESKGAGVAALVSAGRRVIAAEEKTGRLVAIDDAGAESVFAPAAAFRRPTALCRDAAGRIAVLDEKADTLTRLTPKGQVSDTLALTARGVSKPLALAAAPDGAVRILDGATGAVLAAP
jgi:hypothetical protein